MDKKKHVAGEKAEKAEMKEKTAEEAAKEAEKAASGRAAEESTGGAPEANSGKEREGAEHESAGKASARTEAESALERAIAEAEDLKRKWYAVSAEYENYRKRTARESAQRYAEGRADVVKGLFPIADNLDRAYASCSDEATKKGIRMVMDAFEKLLENEKIVAIDPVGQPFDAEKHEAIMAVDPAEGEESGIVKQVYLKGYEKDGKVLRFAQVIVIK